MSGRTIVQPTALLPSWHRLQGSVESTYRLSPAAADALDTFVKQLTDRITGAILPEPTLPLAAENPLENKPSENESAEGDPAEGDPSDSEHSENGSERGLEPLSNAKAAEDQPRRPPPRSQARITVDTVRRALSAVVPPEGLNLLDQAGTAAADRYRDQRAMRLYLKARGKSTATAPASSRSERAGLVLPVSFFLNVLRRDQTVVLPTAAVFLAAAMECLIVDLLESAYEAASGAERKTHIIHADDIYRAVWGGEIVFSHRRLSWMSGNKCLQSLAANVEWTRPDRPSKRPRTIHS